MWVGSTIRKRGNKHVRSWASRVDIGFWGSQGGGQLELLAFKLDAQTGNH